MPEPKAGIIFDKRYLILKELGAGGMGKVYHAKQVDADREVAIKTLRVAVQDDESKTRFFREFKLLSELKHPHIMTVYGLSLDSSSNPYAICEYLEGTSLRDYLANGSLSWNESARIAAEVADALHYAHQNGIIHRDLKPENIMLVNQPHLHFVKVIDFGLSRVMQDGNQKLTGTGQLLGSPQYMSPEQSRQAADHRSDIYSLGCILFEMLSGQALFPADDAIAALYLHSNESATNRFISIQQPIPERLLDLLADMLAKKPDERCQSSEEVNRRLRQIIEEPGKSVAQKSRKKKINTRIIFAAMLMIACVGITLFALKRILPELQKPAAFEAPAKSFRGEVITVDREIQRHHIAQMENTIVPVPKDVTYRKMNELLLRLEPLENRANDFKEKYMVYWLESVCYANLDDSENRLKYLALSLQQLRSRKGKKFAEEPVTLSVMANTLRSLHRDAEAKIHALEAFRLGAEFEKLTKKGVKIPTVLADIFINSGAWSSVTSNIVLVEILMSQGNFAEAEKYAKPVFELELTNFPQTRAGNATITGTLYYATCLVKNGKKDEGVKTVEQVLSVVNKPGDIPIREQRPNELRAVASDILRVYQSACIWFDDNKLPKLVEKYEKKAEEYANYYQLQKYWSHIWKSRHS